MAYLQLFPNGDRQILDLPFCCMRCGAEAATIVRQRFSTRDYFVTVHVPMCNKHRFHWLYSFLLLIGPLVGSIGLFQCIPVFVDTGAQSVALGVAFVLCAALLVAAISLSLVVHRRQIRIVDQFQDSFVLANVSAAFVEALEAMTGERLKAFVDSSAHFTWRFSEERFKLGGDDRYGR